MGELDKMGLDQATVQIYGSAKNVMLRLPNKQNTNSATYQTVYSIP